MARAYDALVLNVDRTLLDDAGGVPERTRHTLQRAERDDREYEEVTGGVS